MGTEQAQRQDLAVELQTSASLVSAALHLLTKHWSELSDDRRRQVLDAARERADHVSRHLDAAASLRTERQAEESSNLLDAE